VRKLSLLLLLAVGVVAGVVVTGCGHDQDRLAAVQSGGDAQIGATMLHGSQIAIDEWNAKGGVLGKQIETISLDDEGNPQKAVTVAQNLVDDGVVAVLGHLNSNCTIPASRLQRREDRQIPRLDQSQYTEQGFPYAFRICGRDDQQGRWRPSSCTTVLKLNKIAILHNKTAYGEGLATEVKKTFEAKGGR
jgi:branched-chain amino acid transport system substrate-binding protein